MQYAIQLIGELKDPQLNDRLKKGKFNYNRHRYHSSLNAEKPMDAMTVQSAINSL